MSGLSLDVSEEFITTLVERVQRSLEPDRRYVSKEKLCELLGIQPRTVQTWRTRGLPGIRVGKAVMYDLPAVERWIEGH